MGCVGWVVKLKTVPAKCHRCGSTFAAVDWKPLRRIRERAGLSRAEMAERLGISPCYVSAIETGTRRITAAIEAAYERLA